MRANKILIITGLDKKEIKLTEEEVTK